MCSRLESVDKYKGCLSLSLHLHPFLFHLFLILFHCFYILLAFSFSSILPSLFFLSLSRSLFLSFSIYIISLLSFLLLVLYILVLYSFCFLSLISPFLHFFCISSYLFSISSLFLSSLLISLSVHTFVLILSKFFGNRQHQFGFEQVFYRVHNLFL